MSKYAHIKRCLELSDKDIASAVEDRQLVKALLDQLAKVSKPGDGAPKVLLVFSKLAAAGVDWFDGSLRVELAGDGDTTSIEVLAELGLGMHERVLPAFKMGVPLDELARAVERVPHMISPLVVASKSARRLVLTAASESDGAELEENLGEAVEIDDDSLYASSDAASAVIASPIVRIDSPARSVSSGKHRAVKIASKPAPAPRVIPPNTGNTLGPGPLKTKSAPPAKRESARPAAKRASVKPPKRESAKPAKRASVRPPRASERPPKSQPPASVRPVVPKAPPLPRMEVKPAGAAIARVALTKVPASQRVAARPAVEKRRSTRPPPLKAPSKSAPPAKPRAGKGSEADDEGVDTGWDDE